MADAAHTVTFGASADFLALEFKGVEYDEPEPYRWVRVQVLFRFGAFKGSFPASFLTGEVRDMHAAVRTLHSTLRGVVEFSTLEHQVQFTLEMATTGKLKFMGQLTDNAAAANRLKFETELDQTYLVPVLAALDRVVLDRL
ncbi:WapI family immunity protein [Devosia sp.]|uniref:WapI family immunity protein n=1 Tax=Devosia sp. TaxID=1871048 RepID=UPI003BA87849